MSATPIKEGSDQLLVGEIKYEKLFLCMMNMHSQNPIDIPATKCKKKIKLVGEKGNSAS